jgi:hypothetical protein
MIYEEVRVLLSPTPTGKVEATFTFEGESEQIKHCFMPPKNIDAEALYRDWLNSFKPGSKVSCEELAKRRDKIGHRLFETLFKKAAVALRERLTALEQRQAGDELCGLRLRLILGDATGTGNLAAADLLRASRLPWELSLDQKKERRLAKSRFISLVRTIGSKRTLLPTRVRVGGKLRVLVVDSQPEGATPINWPAEKARIKKALRKWKYADLEFLDHASFAQTCRRLEEGFFNVIHFIGHGGFDAKSQQWYLLFEKNRKKDRVYASDIADRLGNIPTLKVAVFNACRSGELPGEADGDPLSGVAAAVSVAGVPVVVAMQIPVTDSMAIEFSEAFYGALRSGLPVEAAVAQGRQVVRLSSPEWATPVLYLRGSSSELFDFRALSGESTDIPNDRSDDTEEKREGSDELVIGVRSFVESKDYRLADWAVKLNETTERFAPLEEFFQDRFIRDPADWNKVLLPRLEDFLSDAVNQHRPLALCLATHATVAFATGYFFYTKEDAPLSLLQMSTGKVRRWSPEGGSVPQGPLWQPFVEQPLNSGAKDIAVSVEITKAISENVKSYLKKDRMGMGRLISARIVGEPGKARIKSGAHAFQLALQLYQWLNDHASNHSQRRLHLFISAPNDFIFFLGQLARNLGSIRLYEHAFEDAEHGIHRHFLDLPPERVAFQQDALSFSQSLSEVSVKNRDGNVIIGGAIINSSLS